MAIAIQSKANQEIVDRFNRRYKTDFILIGEMVEYMYKIGWKRREIANYIGKKPSSVDNIRAQFKHKILNRPREYNCMSYKLCLTKAAKSNCEMKCKVCADYKPEKLTHLS